MQRLSTALCLPSMTQLLHPSLRESRASTADSVIGIRTKGKVKPTVNRTAMFTDSVAKVSQCKAKLSVYNHHTYLTLIFRAYAIVFLHFLSFSVLIFYFVLFCFSCHPQGSQLPVANMHMKSLKSCISETPIQGTVVALRYVHVAHTKTKASDVPSNRDAKASMEASDSDRFIDQKMHCNYDNSYLAGVNETLAWGRVIPFLPDMSGEFVQYK